MSGTLDNGDGSFETLYHQSAERLRNVVFRRLYRGKTTPDSVMQSVFLSVAKQLQANPGPTEEECLWRLLLRTAIRHCDKHNKRTVRERARGVSPVPLSALEREGGRVDLPERGVELEDVIEAEDWLDYALKRLDPQEQDVLRLKLIGCTIEEIASQKQMTMVEVRAYLVVIRDTIQDLLQREADA